ncbi:Origin recognition complex subunit 3 [Saxophila tyrrhenica]|uniref:Origin recognition complex subunit 3 n=1 Tax=Saxophila tyrrhenica TaxID=1690608 RepID=A0AAV9PFI8_9PEZI|nr:Origin recognition complex subunit 3 [Saxophila tyrrhenica]
MEYEKCYVYEPEGQGPAKRRQIEPQGLQASWKLRREAYQAAWRAQKAQIDAKLSDLNAYAVRSLTAFLDEAAQSPQSSAIPTAILSTGPEASSSTAVTEQLSRDQNAQKCRVFLSISASTGPNLKALLKAIIQKATSRQESPDDDDEDDEVTTRKKGAKLLNYDLQLLADYVSERQLEQVAIAVGDTEGFDSDLLSELVELLGYWCDRIPVVLLLSVATSAESLQQRLSRSAVRCLKGQMFDVAASAIQLEHALEAVVADHPTIWPGSDLIGLILERQSDYIQSIDSFTHAIQYTYMSHYSANALSILLIPSIKFANIPPDHFEALRNVDSFRQHCRGILDDNQASRVRELLDSDEKLFNLAADSIRDLRDRLNSMLPAMKLLQHIQDILHSYPVTPTMPFSKAYKLAMAGRLTQDSSFIRSMLLSVRKSQQHIIGQVLQAFNISSIPATFRSQAETLGKELIRLSASAAGENVQLRSEESVKNSTLRTTVVAQKVELSKQKATLSKRDESYTKLLRRLSDLLERYFGEALVDPKTCLFHELVVYDLRSPYRDTFTPRPRQAIERALATPHDYLDCDCCGPDAASRGKEMMLASSQPTTAVLYQLYLESGSLINVNDLRQAFLAVTAEDGRSEEENTALFQRALAELRSLGFVKGTRKRADHVAKVAWRGL